MTACVAFVTLNEEPWLCDVDVDDGHVAAASCDRGFLLDLRGPRLAREAAEASGGVSCDIRF
jgi:hypothetical protein